MADNIHAALLQVMNTVGYVQKTGRVKFKTTDYKYAGEADLIAALRPAMLEAGITFSCVDIGSPIMHGQHIAAVYTFRFTHAASDTYVNACAIGQGMDSGDKAAYKAATGAMKYALRQTFVIETGDDPDQHASDKVCAEVDEAKQANTVAGMAKRMPVPNLPTNDLGEIDWQEYQFHMLEHLNDLNTDDEFQAFWKANASNLGKLQRDAPDLSNVYREEFAKRRRELPENLIGA